MISGKNKLGLKEREDLKKEEELKWRKGNRKNRRQREDLSWRKRKERTMECRRELC